MNSKVTTNSVINHTKKTKQKQTKQTTRTEENHRNGDHMEGYLQGSGRGREGRKLERISSINGR